MPLFAFPYLLANLLQAALGIADMGITAMYCGEGGAAAIGVASQIVYLVVNAATGLASGATILIGQRYGAEDREGVRKAVATLTSISLMVAVPTAIGVGVGAKGLLGVLQTPPEAMEGAKAYLIVSMAGLPFVFAYNGLSAVIRGLGNSKIPLMIIGGAAVLNIGLDFVTVGLLKWGVGGAAAATVLAEAMSAAVALGFLVRKTPFRLGDFKPAWDKASAKEIVKIGFPTAVQNATASLSFLLLTVIVNRLQVASVLTVAAAHAMATKFNNFAVLAPRGMSQAMAAIVAQNVGAKKFRRNRSVFCNGNACGRDRLSEAYFCRLYSFAPRGLSVRNSRRVRQNFLDHDNQSHRFSRSQSAVCLSDRNRQRNGTCRDRMVDSACFLVLRDLCLDRGRRAATQHQKSDASEHVAFRQYRVLNRNKRGFI